MGTDKFLYGIDFGTTNSAVSIYDMEKQEILQTITVPSNLYFPFGEQTGDHIKYFVGHDAINEYIKDGMNGRFMKSVKRILPRSTFKSTRIFSQDFYASDLVALVIKDLKLKADAVIGYSCTRAVMGRPVFFDDDNPLKDELAQTRLAEAAKKAGLTDVRFQFEPIGAAFTYERVLTRKQKVLVADLGGGTTDFTFIELDPHKAQSKNRRENIIANGGIYIGGDSFDSAFMWDKGTPHFGKGVQYESMPGKFLEVPAMFFTNICSWEKMNFFNGYKIKNNIQKYYTYTKNNKRLKNLITLIDNNLGYAVFQAIEQTKIDLSTKTESQFKFQKEDINIDKYIPLPVYHDIIEPDLNKINLYIDEFLAKNNIQISDIDSLFLTGGTSLMTSIQDLFKNKFRNIPVNSGDSFISVAKGLAYSGYLFE